RARPPRPPRRGPPCRGPSGPAWRSRPLRSRPRPPPGGRRPRWSRWPGPGGSRSPSRPRPGRAPGGSAGSASSARGARRRGGRGEERIASSPLVLALVLALVFLVLLGLGLWTIIAKTTADRQFNQAEDSYKDGEYLTAAKLYGLFLEGNPKDPRAGKARVMRA